MWNVYIVACWSYLEWYVAWYTMSGERRGIHSSFYFEHRLFGNSLHLRKRICMLASQDVMNPGNQCFCFKGQHHRIRYDRYIDWIYFMIWLYNIIYIIIYVILQFIYSQYDTSSTRLNLISNFFKLIAYLYQAVTPIFPWGALRWRYHDPGSGKRLEPW